MPSPHRAPILDTFQEAPDGQPGDALAPIRCFAADHPELVREAVAVLTGAEYPRPLRLVDSVGLSIEHPGLTENAVRMLIFRAGENGLAPHVYRLGRSVYVDSFGFADWVRGQQ
jgi:hypothetical protein